MKNNKLNIKFTSAIFTLLFATSSFFIFESCERSEIEDDTNDTIVSERGLPHWDCGTCSLAASDIEENMKLAAKGFAGTLNNHNDIKGELESEISAVGILGAFTISGDTAIDAVDNALSQELPDTLDVWLGNFNENLIDTCILRTFKNSSIPLCCNEFVIRIPDYDEQDKTKPIIVFPILRNFDLSPQDDVDGYFLDSSNNLMSMTYEDFVDNDEDENYYVWNVMRLLDCETVTKQEGCDNDGICEFLYGETLECEDCQGKNKTGPKGSLYLWEVESLTDMRRHKNHNPSIPEKRYQEWYWNNKYELAFQFAIYNTQNTNVEYQMVIDDTPTNEPYPHEADIIDKFECWGKNAEVKRTKQKKNGNHKSNKGSHTLKSYVQSKLLSNNFSPDVDELYYLLYEKDWKLTHPENVGYDFGVYINRGPGNVRRPYTHSYSGPGGFQDWMPVHGGVSGSPTTNNGGACADQSDDILFVDNDPSLWVPIAPIGGKPAYEYNHTTDGEFRIKFVWIED